MKINFDYLINSPKNPFNISWTLKDVFLIFIIFYVLFAIYYALRPANISYLDDHVFSLSFGSFICIYLKNKIYVLNPISKINKSNILNILLSGLLGGALSCIFISVVLFTTISNALMSMDIYIATHGLLTIIKRFGMSNFFLVPMIEELFFRGLLYSALRRKKSMIFSMIISSLLFTLYHSHIIATLSIVDILGVFIPSMIFAFIYEKNNNILIPFIAHASYNIYLKYVYFALTIQNLLQ